MQKTHRAEILLSKYYDFPIQSVWESITNKEDLSSWLMQCDDFELELGHNFHFRTKARPGFDGIVYCKILDFDAPHKLVYSWQGGPMKTPTTLIWTLHKQGDGTMLHLEHFGFSGMSGTFLKMLLKNGWKSLLNAALAEHLENR